MMPTKSLTNREWELLSRSECQLALGYEISDLLLLRIVYCFIFLLLSLILRPLPLPPVFDHLQYVNTEREGLGDLVTCGDIRQTEGRHVGPVEAFSCNFHPKGDARALARQHQYHPLFTAPGMGQCEMGIITPPVYLPSVYLASLHVT